MAHAFYHAKSSARRFGGVPEDYLATFLDSSLKYHEKGGIMVAWKSKISHKNRRYRYCSPWTSWNKCELRHANTSDHSMEKCYGHYNDILKSKEKMVVRSMQAKHEYDIATLYQEGATALEIAQLIGVSKMTILRELQRLGVSRRHQGGSTWRAGAAIVCHDFFHSINTEEKAYWLGFITADGCVQKDRMTVVLHVQDRKHLEKLRADLGIENSIREYEQGKYLRVQWSSAKMREDLRALGVVERKSWCAYPAQIAEDLQRHYWRGLVDGDGSLAMRKNRESVYPQVTMCGTKAIVDGFVAFCKRITPTHINTRKTQWEGHYMTMLLGSHARRVADALYSGSTIYLDRKHEIWNSMRDTK